MKGQRSCVSPAVGLLWFGQRVVEERVSVVRIVLHVQVQVQVRNLPLQAGGRGPVVGRLTVSGDLLLEVSFTQRRLALRVLMDHTETSVTLWPFVKEIFHVSSCSDNMNNNQLSNQTCCRSELNFQKIIQTKGERMNDKLLRNIHTFSSLNIR